MDTNKNSNSTNDSDFDFSGEWVELDTGGYDENIEDVVRNPSVQTNTKAQTKSPPKEVKATPEGEGFEDEAEYAEEAEQEDTVDPDNTEDDERDDEDEPAVLEEEEEEDEDEVSEDKAEPESEDEPEEVETDVSPPVKTQSRIPKRIEKLITKLRQKDDVFAQKELQYLEALQNLALENQQLKGQYSASAVAEAEARLKAVRDKLKNAQEMGDTDILIEATEELTDAKVALTNAKQLAASLPKETPQIQRINKEQIIAKYKAESWVSENPQVLSDNNLKSLTSNVMNALLTEGFSEASDEFYDELVSRVNKSAARFGISSRLKTLTTAFTEGDDEMPPKKSTQGTKPSAKAPVKPKGGMPASKSPKTTPKKQASRIAVPKEEIEFASKYGIPKDYIARQRLLSQTKTDTGYTDVYIPTKK